MNTRARSIGRGYYAVALAVLAAHTLHALGVGKPALDGVFEPWVYTVLMWSAAIGCCVRAATVRHERGAWVAMSAYLTLWAAADALWDFHYDAMSDAPWPNFADGLYLSSYAVQYVGMLLLLSARLRPWRLAMWLDGLVGGLAAASLGACFIFPAILGATDGDALAVVVTLAYPLLDCVALGVVVLAFSLCDWRPGRQWLLLGAGLVALALADAAYNYLTATDTYHPGTLVSALWPTGALLTSLAAWQRPASQPVRHRGLAGASITAVSALVALGVLGAELLGRHSVFGGALALGAIVLVVVRCLLTVRENDRIIEASERDALTDALSGLPNRRSLLEDLGDVCASGQVATLGFFDLNGFKAYNDAFGHGAGDTLLARLGGRLEHAVAGHGRAYRLGGDEFCVLLHRAATEADPTIDLAGAALSDHGGHFAVTASLGLVTIPHEAGTPESAIGLADERMYAHKRGGRASGPAQLTDVLRATLREREPGLAEHHGHVAAMATAVAAQLGCTGEALDEIARAAELHDVGKVAIPDAILAKPGPLTEDEWAYMRQHTIIGERILASAPPLRAVAQIVRSSHESYDGSGYPDRLAGEQIPLGARIVSVCDAFDAMVADRAYRRGRSQREAVAELRRCAGSQFDPRVVEAFAGMLSASTLPAVS